MDTVTLALEGDEIELDDFAQAVQNFSVLIGELSKQGKAPKLRWEIIDLVVSSATTTAKATSLNGYVEDQIDQIVRSFSAVGAGLSEGTTEQLAPAVKKPADGIAKVLNRSVRSIRFETPESDIRVYEAPSEVVTTHKAAVAPGAWGAVTGRIQTLSSRSSYRFTLYDRMHDKAVGCYLRQGQEDLVRGAWDKLATVVGWVSRDPISGRPTGVRDISAVHVLPPGSEGGYIEARGASPHDPEKPPPEDRIRELRDAS